MKRIKILLFFLVIIFIITFLYLKDSEHYRNYIEVYISKPDGKPTQIKERSSDRRHQYFAEWHYPYGSILSTEKLDAIWKDIEAMPKETGSLNSWNMIGPSGIAVDTAHVKKYSGRVLDIKLGREGSIRIAAATGGLWATGNPPVPLSDKITSLAVSTFDYPSSDSNLIILGTGESGERSGTGLWRTSDGGANWTRISLGNSPGVFFKIRFSPGSSSVVHAATDNGYYRSDNAGLNWTKYLDDRVSDVDINPQNTNILYCGVWERGAGTGGFYKSSNGGNNWAKVTAAPLPSTNVGRTWISIHRNNPNIIYTLIARKDNNEMRGIYRTVNGGDFWTDVSPPEDILDGLGWYMGCLAVSPTSFLNVVTGGLWSWRTTNGGINWFMLNDVQSGHNIHADQHAAIWDSTGENVWIGHDGGTSFSSDRGQSFVSVNNNWPITQYLNFDISNDTPNVIFGGSRDNSFSGTTNGGLTWFLGLTWAGDGGGMAINPFNSAEIFGCVGVFGGPLAFHRMRSTNYGISWSDIINGIGASSEYYPKIRANNSSPLKIYTNSWNNLYSSSNNGANWSAQNPTPFPTSINDFSIRDYGAETIIYVCVNSATTGQRLRMQSGGGEFVERANGITEGHGIRKVSMHQTNKNIAYALINGLEEGEKVYKTTDQGANWTNISGNLPDVPVADLIPYPYNDSVLYLGTEMGCFKTTTAGTNWFRWNDGMPEAAMVTEMKSYFANNEFHIMGSTYGRGIWLRKEKDVITNLNGIQQLPSRYVLNQNYPNPFNPFTIISFEIPVKSKVKLKVFDINGKEIASLVNSELDNGTYRYEFDGANLPSGVYFYKLETSSFSETKKMMLLK